MKSLLSSASLFAVIGGTVLLCELSRGAWAGAASLGRPESISASELIIVDKAGKRRIRLGVGDAEGKRGGPFIELCGEDEKPRVELALIDDSKRFVAFRDAEGNYEMMLQYAEERYPSLVFFGEKDSRIELGIGPSGRSSISLEGGSTDGLRAKADITLMPTQDCIVAIRDSKGKGRVELISNRKGGTELKFLDGAGKVKWKAP